VTHREHNGKPCVKKTMCEREISAHIEAMLLRQDEYISKLQKIFDDKNYCGTDFITLLFNYCVQQTAAVIKNAASTMDEKRSLFDGFSAALAVELGGRPVSVEQIIAQFQKEQGATVN